MPVKQIVGLVLVRNEDIHVGRAVANITAFCDRILLADHRSEVARLGQRIRWKRHLGFRRGRRRDL
jgi:hypothetical protein